MVEIALVAALWGWGLGTKMEESKHRECKIEVSSIQEVGEKKTVADLK